MPLSVGDKLGPYEVLAPIGAGGMGEVFKARDTRLNRIVAVKISKDQFTERFEREARAVAALNHAHICHLYDVGPNYLVMEWVDGEDLKGPLPLEEALRIAEQIAEALQEAHEKGIAHRDLKPANIKITPEGSVKVLDFGLAKIEPDSSGDPENSPTLSLNATKAGMILGTAAYMAPEQARGKPADRRADIWAFGVVLYEMLTGERAFQGEDITDILASVVKEQPDLSRAPASLRPLLKSCLEKDRKKRLQAIGDWKLLLEQPTAAPAPATGSRSLLWPIVAALAILTAAAVSFLHFREAPTPEPSLRLSIPLPEKFSTFFFALSPDGRTLVLNGLTNGANHLWLRDLDSFDMRPLANTDGARNPFWSADGRFVGFFAQGKLKTVPVSGGPATPLCDTGAGGGGDWSREGVILFSAGGVSTPIQRVNAAGGPCTLATPPDSGLRYRLPVFLPDGKHFLAVAQATDPSQSGLYLNALDQQTKPRRLLPDQSSAVFVPRRKGESHDLLLFQRENKLMAQPFNAETLQLAGDPVFVAPQLSRTLTLAQVAATANASGTLVYLSGSSREDFQAAWLDRSGKELAKASPLGEQRAIALSPDQKTVALGFMEDSSRAGIWLRDLARDSETRFTQPPFMRAAVWSPDGKRIAFAGATGLYAANATGSAPELLVPGNRPLPPSDWSRDGKYVLYTDTDPKRRGDIWYVPFDASGKPGPPVAFLKTEFSESEAQFSPDGHWVAYVSNESGRNQVYVRPFPSGGGAIRVSAIYGTEPRWRGDGAELYFLSGGDPISLMAVSVLSHPGRTLEIGVPKALFPVPSATALVEGNMFLYAPAADGQRFLMNLLPDAAPPTLNVITNWRNALPATVK